MVKVLTITDDSNLFKIKINCNLHNYLKMRLKKVLFFIGFKMYCIYWDVILKYFNKNTILDVLK